MRLHRGRLAKELEASDLKRREELSPAQFGLESEPLPG